MGSLSSTWSACKMAQQWHQTTEAGMKRHPGALNHRFVRFIFCYFNPYPRKGPGYPISYPSPPFSSLSLSATAFYWIIYSRHWFPILTTSTRQVWQPASGRMFVDVFSARLLSRTFRTRFAFLIRTIYTLILFCTHLPPKTYTIKHAVQLAMVRKGERMRHRR